MTALERWGGRAGEENVLTSGHIVKLSLINHLFARQELISVLLAATLLGYPGLQAIRRRLGAFGSKDLVTCEDLGQAPE
jgi:hypothetical protein